MTSQDFAAAASGALVVAGLLGVARSVIRARPALGGAGGRPAAAAPGLSAVTGVDDAGTRLSRWARPLGGLAARALGSAGLMRSPADLAILERPAAAHALTKVLGALVGAALGPVLAFAMGVGGLGRPAAVAAGAAFGFLAPDYRIRDLADAKRDSFVNAQACAMELIAGAVEAGEALPAAIDMALNASDNWAFVRLRHCVAAARVQRVSPWAAIDRLASDIGLPELESLANTVETALRSGAPAREALESAAEALMSQQLVKSKTAAHRRALRRTPAVVLLALAPFAFVLFCAVNASFTYVPE